MPSQNKNTTANDDKKHFAHSKVRPTEKQRTKQKHGWPCPVGHQAFVIAQKYLVVPLTSAVQIKKEAYHMQNCTREYIERCREGNYLLFSIQSRNGKRIATLGAGCSSNYWHFDDCMGEGNAEVTEKAVEYTDDEGYSYFEDEHTDLYYAACEVIRLLNAQQQEVQEK